MVVIITKKEVLKLNVNISFKLKDAGNFKTQNNIWETGNTNDKKNIKKQKKDAIKACLLLSVVFSTVLYPLLGILYCDRLLESFSILKKINTNKIKKNDSW